MEITTNIYLGDSKNELKKISDNVVDLIVTSPPYADQRKDTYGGIQHDKYVEWFLPISEQLYRVLKPTGTFILNIKEKVVNGERSTYVMELIIAMRKQGWLWTEEFIWHKKNSYPGKWPNRFRDSWERLLQFNKSKRFNMYQEEVMVPMGDWAKTRLKKLSETDKTRDVSKVGSGFGKNISNWLERDKAFPTNVLHLATECNNKNHSAAFPEELPEWFIKLFTKKNDIVLDPFMGSGTTLTVAKRMQRNSIGIDIVQDYYNLVEKQIKSSDLYLLEHKTKYMEKIKQKDVIEYVEKNIGAFHSKRIQSLDKLKLNEVLKRKNPYLYKAKYVLTADKIVRSILDAHISSNEETIFGDWLEGLAIFINGKVYGGKKSGITGIDLEFDAKGYRYIVNIKSGPNWGNSSQIRKMIDDFKTAKKALRTSNSKLNIVSVNGCCYGRDNKPDKGEYYKYCGQKFWDFISGDINLYTDIIEPLGHKAKERNEDFMKLYSQIINKFDKEFTTEFCSKDGSIDWNKIVKLNSAIKS